MVEPFQKLDGSFAAVFVGFAFISIKDILVVADFRKVKIGKFVRNIGNRPTSVAHVMAPTFAAFLADQNPGGRDFNAGLKLGGVVGSTAWIEKGGSSRSSLVLSQEEEKDESLAKPTFIFEWVHEFREENK